MTVRRVGASGGGRTRYGSWRRFEVFGNCCLLYAYSAVVSFPPASSHTSQPSEPASELAVVWACAGQGRVALDVVCCRGVAYSYKSFCKPAVAAFDELCSLPLAFRLTRGFKRGGGGAGIPCSGKLIVGSVPSPLELFRDK